MPSLPSKERTLEKGRAALAIHDTRMTANCTSARLKAVKATHLFLIRLQIVEVQNAQL